MAGAQAKASAASNGQGKNRRGDKNMRPAYSGNFGGRRQIQVIEGSDAVLAGLRMGGSC